MSKMNNKQFVDKAIDIAKNYKTLYVMGCFGAPLKASNIDRYINAYDYNAKAARKKMIKAAADTKPKTFGFDCVCLIKAILWGWNGNEDANYGGAEYAVNGVPDINEDAMINLCSGVSTDFSKIEIGEVVWLKGHIGIYIGDGLAVECTPAWKNCVQITACNTDKKGYNRRDWKKHGKLPYITYEAAKAPETKPQATTGTLAQYTDEQLAAMVWEGKFGNGADRKKALAERYNAVQAIVDKQAAAKEKEKAPETKPQATTGTLAQYTDEQLAAMVWEGKFGNGADRKKALAERYNAVQAIVDKQAAAKEKEKAPAPVEPVKQVYKGAMLNVKDRPLYASATTKQVANKVTGTYYAYDGVVMNGRIRITPLQSFVGKFPLSKYVTGWIDV